MPSSWGRLSIAGGRHWARNQEYRYSPRPSLPTVPESLPIRTNASSHPQLSQPVISAEPSQNRPEDLSRLHAAIDYTRHRQNNDQQLMQRSQFYIPYPSQFYIPYPSQPARNDSGQSSNQYQTMLAALHAEMNALRAPQIRSDDHGAWYELGFPPPPPEGLHGILHPQWWVGKSAAEVRAGPDAEPWQVERAERQLAAQARKKETKADKRRRQEVEDKLEEGLRRQEAGLPMCDDDEEDEKMPDYD